MRLLEETQYYYNWVSQSSLYITREPVLNYKGSWIDKVIYSESVDTYKVTWIDSVIITIKCLISAPGRLLILQQFSPRDPAYCARVVYQILTFGHILRGAWAGFSKFYFWGDYTKYDHNILIKCCLWPVRYLAGIKRL